MNNNHIICKYYRGQPSNIPFVDNKNEEWKTEVNRRNQAKRVALDSELHISFRRRVSILLIIVTEMAEGCWKIGRFREYNYIVRMGNNLWAIG